MAEKIGSGEGFHIQSTSDENVIAFLVRLDGGKPSSTGKMHLTANSHGWQELPGYPGFRFNLTVGRKA